MNVPTCVQSQRCGSDHFITLSEDALVHTSIGQTKVGDLKFTGSLLTNWGCFLSDGNPAIINHLFSVPDPHHWGRTEASWASTPQYLSITNCYCYMVVREAVIVSRICHSQCVSTCCRKDHVTQVGKHSVMKYELMSNVHKHTVWYLWGG